MTATPDTSPRACGPVPDDTTLTQRGTGPAGSGSVLLIACGALAREIIDVRQRHGWLHLDLTCLPAILHNQPEKITQAVRDVVARHRADYDTIHVLYGDCGTGGLLAAACSEMGVEMLPGPHCYSFFEGTDVFAARDEVTSFYLTDFLVRQFDAFVWRPLGLDRHPDLLEMYFGNYETLVYQAQTDDPALAALAERHAQRLGLAFERRLVGYGDLETSMTRWAGQR